MSLLNTSQSGMDGKRAAMPVPPLCVAACSDERGWGADPAVNTGCSQCRRCDVAQPRGSYPRRRTNTHTLSTMAIPNLRTYGLTVTARDGQMHLSIEAMQPNPAESFLIVGVKRY